MKKEASGFFLIQAHHGTGQEKELISDRLTIGDSTRVRAKVDTFKIEDIPGASPDKDALRSALNLGTGHTTEE